MNIFTVPCHCCGTAVPVSREAAEAALRVTPKESRAEAIEIQVATWRAWCADNNVQLIPGDLVDEGLAATLVGTIQPVTLRNRRHDGRQPAYIRRGKTPLYKLHVLAGWIIDGCP